jgi:hypothetical protein
MNKLEVCVATLVVVCSLTWVALSPAQNSNNNKKVSKPRATVDAVREPDPPEVGKSTDTAKNRADQENARARERARVQRETAAKKPKPKEPPSPK